MKKTIIILSIFIGLIALVPIVGNTLVKETLDKKMLELESKGIKVTKQTEEISYLESSRHYEFLVQDSEKFLRYLQKYSEKQLPPYTNALIGGTLVGMDINYSNIPLSKAISLDVYPLSLPDEVMKDIEENDPKFSQYIEEFLFKKGILYHINYDIVSTDFDGYIKDVNENYTLENNAKAVLNISKTTFKGSGNLIAPSYLKADSKRIMIKFMNPNEEMTLDLKDFTSSSNFENKTTYISTSSLESLLITMKTPYEQKEIINISNIYLNVSSNTQGETAELNTKASFETMLMKLQEVDINASKVNCDIALSKIDKVSYEKLRLLLTKEKVASSFDFSPLVKQNIIGLLSKGIQANIIDLSLQKIIINNEDLDGFTISSELDLNEDPALAGKMLFSPLFILGNVDFDFKSKVSKKILNEVTLASPLPFSFNNYPVNTNNEVVLDVAYKRGNLKINGKPFLGGL